MVTMVFQHWRGTGRQVSSKPAWFQDSQGYLVKPSLRSYKASNNQQQLFASHSFSFLPLLIFLGTISLQILGWLSNHRDLSASASPRAGIKTLCPTPPSDLFIYLVVAEIGSHDVELAGLELTRDLPAKACAWSGGAVHTSGNLFYV